MPQYPSDISQIVNTLERRLKALESARLIDSGIIQDPPDPPPGTDVTDITGISHVLTYRTNPFNGGLQSAHVKLTWDELIPVTPDGSNYVIAYEVQYRSTQVVTSTWSTLSRVTVAEISFLDLKLDTDYDFRIRSVTRRGFRSAWFTYSVDTTHDLTPPPQPSDPVVTGQLGGIRIAWDGKDISAQPMPGDFDHVDVHVSLTSGFTPDATNKVAEMTGASYFFVPALTSTYVVHYVKFIAYDTTGNASVVSTQIQGVPLRATGGDIGSGEVSYDEIAFKNQGNLIADGSFEVQSWRDRISQSSFNTTWFVTTPVFSWINSIVDAFHGAWYFRANAAQGSGTRAAILSDVVGLNGIQVEENQKYLFRLAWKADVGAPGNVNVDLRWVNDAGTAIVGGTTLTLVGSTSGGAWLTASTFTTAPAGATYCVPRVTLISSANTGLWAFDAFELRRVIQTEIIDDLAVTNAKIGNLAVDNGKIANLDAGKINAGFVSADRIQLGAGMGINLHPSPSFESSAYRANYPSTASQFSWQSSGGFDGSWKLRIAGDGTADTMTLLNIKGFRGERYYVGFLQKTTTPATGVFQIGAFAFDETGTYLGTLPGAVSVGVDLPHETWRKRQGILGPAPHGTATVQFFAFADSSMLTGGNFEVDLLEIRGIVGTTTVNASSRVELSPIGIKMYDSATRNTVDIDANTGNVKVAGELWSGLDLSKRRIKINPDTTNLAEIQFFTPNDVDFAFINSFTTANDHAALGLNAEGTGDQAYSMIMTDQQILLGRMDGDTLTPEEPAIDMIGDQFSAGGLKRIFLLGRIPSSAGGFNRTCLMGGTVADQTGTTGTIKSYGLSMTNAPKVTLCPVNANTAFLYDAWHLVVQSGTQWQVWHSPLGIANTSWSWIAVIDP